MLALTLGVVAACGGGRQTLGVAEIEVPDQPRATMLAGASKVDITPMAGMPLGGHAIEGGTGYGLWTRLWARAIYLEDPSGEPLVLVAVDLWAVPSGMMDDVVERVRDHHGLRQLGRAQVLISATHTHHSPANYMSNKLYNRAASNTMGFDPDVHAFMVDRLALAIAGAAAAKRPATLQLETATVAGVARNRSLPPFLRNPEAAALLAANADLPTCPDYPREVEGVDPCQAIDPTLTTLRLDGLDGEPVAVAAFFASHPTTLVNKTDAYSGDYFAIATARAEAALASASSVGDPVVALFNGPQGDVSPNWDAQGRAATEHLGARLGAAIVETARLEPSAAGGCAVPIAGTIENAFIRQPMAEQPVAGPPSTSTAKRALPGRALIAGAEDGPTRFRARTPEGQTVERHRRAGQGPKKPLVPPALFTLLFPRSALPQEAPLSVHRVGPLTIAGLPGEFTTVMGMRIRSGIAASNAPGAPRPILVGLAGEYMSYFVTPEEYTLQHYEGGSTMWGQYAGSFIAERLAELATAGPTPVRAPAVDRPGMTRSFALRPGGRARRALRDLDDRLREQLDIDAAPSTLAQLKFETAAPSWTTATWPTVRVEVRGDDGWTTLHRDGRAVDWHGEAFVSFPEAVGEDRWRWSIWWLGAAEAGETLRLRVDGPGGEVLCSAPFGADDPPSPDARPCADPYEAPATPDRGLGVHP